MLEILIWNWKIEYNNILLEIFSRDIIDFFLFMRREKLRHFSAKEKFPFEFEKWFFS